MTSRMNELESQLKESWTEETRLIEQIRKLCEISENSWLEDSQNRPKRMESVRQTAEQFLRKQTHSNSLLKNWQEVHGPLTEGLSKVRDAKHKSLQTAIETIRTAENQAISNKDALLTSLTESNRTQEMLGAYRQR